MPNSELERQPFDEHEQPEAPDRPSGGMRAPLPNDGVSPVSTDAKIFHDADGVTWWVHEVDGEQMGTAGTACLLIVSANELRRLWQYPSDWRSLSPEELLRLR